MNEQNKPDAVFETLLRYALQEKLRDHDLFPEPEPAAEPMSPGWAAKEKALLKRLLGDDSEWRKKYKEEQK